MSLVAWSPIATTTSLCTVRSRVARAATGAVPGVLLVHGGAGLDDTPRQAERVAAFQVRRCSPATCSATASRGTANARWRTIGGLIGDPDRLCARAQAGTLDVLRGHPRVDGRIAAVGYCFGGTTVLELARAGADVAGVASIHGGLRRHRTPPVAPVEARVLVCHGAADPHVPPADLAAFVDEMTARRRRLAAARPTAGCCTASPIAALTATPGVAFDADADARSAAALRQFLAELFGEARDVTATSSPATPARTAAATRSAR